MKKVLILGGSHRDIPLIKAAQELGYYVITLGARAYYLGHKYSDKYYLIDFNDLEAVKKIYIEEDIDYLLPGCGEESYLNTVKLSHQLNIGNFDTLEIAQLIHDKWKFKEFCLLYGIATPKGFLYHESKRNTALNFPVVVKPTNLSGGRGVEIVYNEEALQHSIKEAKRVSQTLFLEEYIEGALIAYSVFLQDKRVSYAFCGADVSYLNKYLVSTAYPIELEQIVEKRLRNNIEKLASKLDLVDGMFHLQVIVKNATPYIIDVTRRIPGDFYPYLIEKSDNIAYSKAVVQAYTTGNITENLVASNNSFVIRHVVMPSKNGVYEKLFIDENLKDSITFLFELEEQYTVIENYLHTQLAVIFITLTKKDTTILNNINKLIYPIIS